MLAMGAVCSTSRTQSVSMLGSTSLTSHTAWVVRSSQLTMSSPRKPM